MGDVHQGTMWRQMGRQKAVGDRVDDRVDDISSIHANINMSRDMLAGGGDIVLIRQILESH